MKTVLLIPGLVSDRFVWEATLSALSGVPSVVADVTSQPTITAMAEDLLTRHSGSLILAGHSMGGRVAMEMARLEPGRIDGMALLNTGIHPRREGEDAKRQAMIDLANRDGMAKLAEVWLPGMMNAEAPPDPTLMASLAAMVQRMSPDIHERQLRALLSRPDASAAVGAYQGPVLLIVGRQDVWSPIAQHEDIQRLCPQARLDIIENAGHFAPVEQPDAVAGRLSTWIKTLAVQEAS